MWFRQFLKSGMRPSSRKSLYTEEVPGYTCSLLSDAALVKGGAARCITGSAVQPEEARGCSADGDAVLPTARHAMPRSVKCSLKTRRGFELIELASHEGTRRLALHVCEV